MSTQDRHPGARFGAPVPLHADGARAPGKARPHGRFTLDRRTVLRGVLGGAAATVALPALEAMLNPHGEAWADGGSLPDRFGVWFWGNGVRLDRWTPTGSGPWSPSDALSPLSALIDHVSVVSGCEIKTATHPHHSGMTGIMTGQRYHQLGTTRDTIVTTFAAQSVDQLAADWMDGLAPFRSLELGVTRFRGTDEGSTFEHLSHNGPNSPNPAEYEPSRLYDRLFGLPADPQRDLVRQSVLDTVQGQVRRLEGRVGAADRLRLEQHLDSVRALETRLAADVGACTFGERPGSFPDVEGLEPIAARNAAMSELLTLALACDLSRVFSVEFSTAGSGAVFWEVGATEGLHGTCHTEALPQPIVHAATRLTMGYLAELLQRLKDTPEGAGSLLDRCSILCTTELTDGYTHSNADFPILVAGKGGGRLRGGVHYRSPSAESTSHAVLTALRGAGVDLPSFGLDAGYSDTPIGALLT